MQRNFTYYSDPGHGWVQVHKAFLEQLVGCDWRIVFSSFSYYSRRDGFVYLEEDSDAPKFLGLCLANSVEPTFTKQNFDTECFIRSLAPL